MSNKQQYLQFPKLITKNVFLTTIVILLSITTIGASAAEIFAPTEFKPSTLLSNNKTENKTDNKNPENSTEKESETVNQIQPLVADAEHDVEVIEECDLTVKFRKLSTANFYEYNSDNINRIYGPIDKSDLNIIPNYNFSIGVMSPFGMVGGQDFECFNSNLDFKDFINIGHGDMGPRLNPETGNMLVENSANIIDFCTDAGLTEASCKLVTNVVKMKTKFGDQDYINSYFFNADINSVKKSYYISSTTATQIQFNSLAPSTPTTTFQSIKDGENGENAVLEGINGVNFILTDVAQDGTMLLQKEDPDGYYSLKSLPKDKQGQNSPQEKISEIGKMYKIWGKINSNREIVEITKVEVVAETKKTVSKTSSKTYTNQYFPNLKVNYDDSWEFNTVTTPSETHTNLLERVLTFKKDNSILAVSLFPLHTPSGCGGYPEGTLEEVPVAEHFRIYEDFNERYVYSRSKDPSCILGNNLKTTIKANEVKFEENYLKVNGGAAYYETINEPNIIYNYFIRLETNNQAHIKEADEIIKNSIFE